MPVPVPVHGFPYAKVRNIAGDCADRERILEHEQLDVYQVALEFLVFAIDVIERLPRGRSHLADQLTRASTSIVLNLAEGAGKEKLVRIVAMLIKLAQSCEA